MSEDAIRADMMNGPKRLEAAYNRALARCREAAVQGGNADAAWSMGEKLLNALVFERRDQLASLGYSEAEAVDRLRYDFGVTTEQFPEVLARIRTQL